MRAVKKNFQLGRNFSGTRLRQFFGGFLDILKTSFKQHRFSRKFWKDLILYTTTKIGAIPVRAVENLPQLYCAIVVLITIKF